MLTTKSVYIYIYSGEIAQWLRILTIDAEDPDSLHRTEIVAHSSTGSGDIFLPLWYLHEHGAHKFIIEVNTWETSRRR